MFKPNIKIRLGAAHHDVTQRYGKGDPRRPLVVDLSKARASDIRSYSRDLIRWLQTKGYFA